jgi:hypothetical protein
VNILEKENWWEQMDSDIEFIEGQKIVSETCENCVNSHIDQRQNIFCELKCRQVNHWESCLNFELR